MKMLKAFLFGIVVLFTMVLCQQFVFADVIEYIPSDWQQVFYDDFTNNTGADMSFGDYTGGTGFSSSIAGWKSDLALTTVPVTTGAPAFKINAKGQADGGCKTGANANIFRQLDGTPIDLGTDGEYYISMTMESQNWNSYKQQLILRTADQDNIIALGEVRGNNTAVKTQVATVVANSSKQVYTSTPGDGATMITVVVQISARANSYDIVKVRAFPAGGLEAPSYFPSYWDAEYRFANTDAQRYPNIVNITMSQNAGSIKTSRVDEIACYKSAPILVTKANTGFETNYEAYKMRFYSVGMTLTIDPIPTVNILGNPQELVSKGFYDYTNPENPVLIAGTDTSGTYTIEDGMVGKLLKAKVVVKDTVTGKSTTYYPVVTRVDAKRYQIDRAYFTTAFGGGVRLDTITAGDSKTVSFMGEVRRCSNIAADKVVTTPMYVIIAQYNKDSVLKNIAINGVTDSLKINPDISQNTLTKNQAALTGITVESGDYFKGFVWYSMDNVNPIAFSPNTTDPYFLTTTLLTSN